MIEDSFEIIDEQAMETEFSKDIGVTLTFNTACRYGEKIDVYDNYV